MDIVVSQEHRFDRTTDGRVWTQAAFPRSYYSEYLTVFEGVHVVARVRNVATPPAAAKRADGDGVSFRAVPYFVGPEEFLLRARAVGRAARNAIHQDDAVLLRVQSQIASMIEPMLHRTGRPYGLEVMCNPHEMFASGANDHLLRPIFQLLFHRQMKKQCHRAPAVSYVTEQALQKIYPPAQDVASISYSDVELSADAYAAEPRRFDRVADAFTIVTVGSLEQPYKGVDILIDSVAECVNAGLNIRLKIIGEGRFRRELLTRANKLGDRAEFTGQVPAGGCVRSHLDQADLFVLPSRTEGLPRALLEAMARALPSVGSAVGGVPELLFPEDLVSPGNAVALAKKIQEVALSPQRLASMSARNLIKSRQYCADILRTKRQCFYRHVKDITKQWLSKGARRESA
jgi:glycosyltransferase involved in cell wall biosynthesis